MAEIYVSREEDIVKHANALFVQGEKVDGFAFLPRPLPKDCDGSSVNRLRVFSNDDDEAMVRVREVFRLSVKPSHRFAQIKISELQDCLQEADVSCWVVEDGLEAQNPHPEDPSHGLIKGLPQPGILDNFFSDKIRKRIAKVHPAVL